MRTVFGWLRSGLLPAAAGLAFASSVGAVPSDVFIKFDAPTNGAVAYQGGSTDAQFPGSNGWSVVTSASLGTTNKYVGSGPSFYLVNKLVDAGSPALLQTCGSRGSYGVAQLVFRQQPPFPPGTPPFFFGQFRNVLVTSIQEAGNQGANDLTEQITLKYREAQWTHSDPNGSGGFDWTAAYFDFVTHVGGSGPVPGIFLSSGSLPTGSRYASYSSTLTATGGNAPYAFQVLSGYLPGGVTLSGAGQISGVPTNSGVFNFNVAATDTYGSYALNNYSLTVTNPCAVPSLLTGISVRTNTVNLVIQGSAGCSYQMQSTPVLNGTWSNVGAAFTMPAGGTYNFTDTNATGTRFYRALSP